MRKMAFWMAHFFINMIYIFENSKDVASIPTSLYKLSDFLYKFLKIIKIKWIKQVQDLDK